ncbi:hypothetical protein [Terasakiella sp.]|uniref:hypothetical protein n=1 Tax=Terasakiella sp. TaxID=2034861 RepID=UPI003AA8C7F6
MKKFIVPALAAFVLVGCQQTIPKEVLQLSATSLEDRQLQTRRFETKDEEALLSSSAGVLQDLGFNLEESETKLGLIVGSKDRDATEAGQIAGAIVMAALFGVAMPVDREQKIRVSIATKAVNDEGTEHAVRVTFQRVVWNDRGQVSKSEMLKEPEMYQQFFEKLSKSVFLEAHSI